MYKNEATRAKELNRIFLNSQFKIEDIVEPEYPIVALHSNSTIFYGNDAFCELSQYSHDEIIGLNAWRLFSPE
ncbi:MAG: PAS domain S-box protein, partial [Gammaproteobacteria bacterium]|nr:PAS domain S-box protein [Gammaproteobacteria bacterium]